MNPSDFPVDDAEMAQAQEERLKDIYDAIVRKRDKWITHRATSGIEQRWRVAQRLYEGKDAQSDENALADVLRNGQSRRQAKAQRSRVSINIVAPKVEASVARLCEILLPVDDKNWGVKPKPDQKLARAAQTEGTLVDPTTGQPVGELSQIAQGVRQSYQQAAEAMENRIDLATTECNYNGEQRRMIEDACRLGTGVLKGPRPFTRKVTSYSQVDDPQSGALVFVEKIEEKTEPGSERVDPWNIFWDPACGNDHQRGSGLWEMRDITRRELRALIGVPGFDAEAIADVLAEEPKKVSTAEGRVQKLTSEDGAYQQWEYTGEIEARDFSFLREHAGSPMEEAMAVERCVLVVINDKVVGALPMLTDDLPYDFFCWWKRDDSPAGDGLPHRLENAQRVVTAAWRQLMDNAGLAAGAQLVVLRHLVEPADGDWQLAPRKIWYAKDDLDDARKAMTTFEFNSHIQELMGIVTTAMEMADRESNTPLLMQGDQGAAPDNVGGTLMLFNQANSPLRHRVKLFDDAVTEPHIKRYYKWFMQQGESEDLKGNFEIDARGSTVLVERDAQNLAMMNVAKLAESPMYGPLMAPKALSGLRAILKSFKLNPDDWAISEEEKRQQDMAAKKGPPPPPPPEVAVAQIEKADNDAQRTFEAQRLTIESHERDLDRQYNTSREMSERDISMVQEQNKRDMELTKLASDQQLTLQELQTRTGLEKLKIADGRDRFNAEVAVKQQDGSGI